MPRPPSWASAIARRDSVTVSIAADTSGPGAPRTAYSEVFSVEVFSPLTEAEADRGYFHAHFRRVNPLPYGDVHTLLDIKGGGHYVGTYMAWGSNNRGWWGEGEAKFYIDDDTDHPEQGCENTHRPSACASNAGSTGSKARRR